MTFIIKTIKKQGRSSRKLKKCKKNVKKNKKPDFTVNQKGLQFKKQKQSQEHIHVRRNFYTYKF